MSLPYSQLTDNLQIEEYKSNPALSNFICCTFKIVNVFS